MSPKVEIPPLSDNLPPSIPPREHGFHNTPPDVKTQKPLFYQRLIVHYWMSSDVSRFDLGRGGGIRTPDPLLPKQMRYQAALRPDSTLIVSRMGFPMEWLRWLSPRERIRMPVPAGTQASFRRNPAKRFKRA